MTTSATVPGLPDDEAVSPLDTLGETPSTGDTVAPPPEGPSTTRSVVEWVAVIVGALVVALVIKTFLLQAFFIPTGSMEPTLMVSDRVLVNKLSYKLHDVNRGDLVVFERPDGEANDRIKDLIKRVIALPGETVVADDGHLLIDGRILEEPYLPDDVITTGPEQPVTVPEGHLWVMGDNRGDSRDSRFFGAIDEDLVVGRAFLRVWPPSEISLL